MLRLANVYGPRQSAALEGGVVAIFLERLEAGEGASIFGDGEQTRDFVYVGDVVSAVLAAAERADGIFNVGTGLETSVNRLHELCRDVAGSSRAPGARPSTTRRRAPECPRRLARKEGARLARAGRARSRPAQDLGGLEGAGAEVTWARGVLRLDK